MMILVIGGSGSGKSAYAEKLLCSLVKDAQMKKYYLATMRPLDEEGMRKIERHRGLRRGKDFLTIEQPVRIADALFQMKAGKKAVLLECVSNLTANEMFADGEIRGKEAVRERVIGGVEQIRRQAAQLVVVTNQIFEDGKIYDKTTMDYMDALGKINQELAARADQVVEIVVGIPVPIKEEGGPI